MNTRRAGAALNVIEDVPDVLARNTGGRHECRRCSPEIVAAEVDLQHACDLRWSLLGAVKDRSSAQAGRHILAGFVIL